MFPIKKGFLNNIPHVFPYWLVWETCSMLQPLLLVHSAGNLSTVTPLMFQKTVFVTMWCSLKLLGASAMNDDASPFARTLGLRLEVSQSWLLLLLHRARNVLRRLMMARMRKGLQKFSTTEKPKMLWCECVFHYIKWLFFTAFSSVF